MGLSRPTREFVASLLHRYCRYGSHLFECFDDPRIPATTNELESFFGKAKHSLRAALGCGSTTNSVVTNLGADALITFHQMRTGEPLEELTRKPLAVPSFVAARKRLNAAEAPSISRRSRVRHLDVHLKRLRRHWHGQPPET